jgi:alkanesulfonate monooxygenase SsuD/methylene tetrahydromethanopterin reductase-like flavin-dependent oxidoreductase (luciferase family)
MAYSVASLSWLTRRTFDLGIGAGTFDHEFDVIGQGDEDRVQMMKEQVLIARRLWAGETLAWDSPRYAFTDVDLKPQPLHPVPVWWGGATPAAARLAVDFCEGWLPGRITFPTYATRMKKIRQLCAEQGKPMVMTGAIPITSIGDSFTAAVEAMNLPGLIKNANAQKFWVRPASGEFRTAEDLEGSILAGTPDDIVRDVQRYQELGCDLLIFDLRMRFPDYLEHIRVLADEVLPRVGGRVAAASGAR